MGNEPQRLQPTWCDTAGGRIPRPVDPVRLHLLERVFASFPASTAVLDGDGTIIAVNKRWCEFAMANCRPQSLASTGVGVNYLDACRQSAINDPLARAALDGLERVLSGEQPTFALEYPCHSPDKQRWFMLFASRLNGGGGVIVTHLDITARRLLEEELRQTHELLQSILDHTPALIFVKDLEQRYLLVNQRYEEVLGVSNGNIRGRTATDVFPPDVAQQFAENDRRTLMGDAAHLVEEIVPTQHGAMTVASTQFPIRGSDGQTLAIGGISIDITARKAAEARQRTLVDELNHRMKNLLAVVQSIARNTFRSGHDGPFDEFAARLRALARAQDIAIANERGAQVRDIVIGELAAFGGRVELEGPEVTTKPCFAQALCLVVHELATNAAKYGALSNQNGQVAVRWAIAPDDHRARFRFSWRERGGPPVKPPAAISFGSELIRSMLPQTSGDSPVLAYDPDGFRYEVTVALEDVLEPAWSEEPVRAAPGRSSA